jgi:hypothetical protein
VLRSLLSGLPKGKLKHEIMGFAVLHTSKGKTSSSSLGGHIDRKEDQAHTYKNADPSKLQANVHFDLGHFTSLSLEKAVQERIEEGYTSDKAIRKDAVEYIPMVLTGSHEEMMRIFADHKRAEEWVKANYEFVAKEFGKENMVRFTLHMDEKTPHIHAVVVPITSNGRLSAKEIIGDRKEMSNRQTRYGEAMAEFGLERGVKGSKAIHNSEGWYLGHQKEKQEAELGRMPTFSLSDRINPTKFIETVSDRLKSTSKQAVDASLQAQRREKQMSLVNRENLQLQKQIAKLESEVSTLKYHCTLALAKANGLKLTNPAHENEFEKMNKDYLQKKQITAQKAWESNRDQKIEKKRGLGL